MNLVIFFQYDWWGRWLGQKKSSQGVPGCLQYVYQEFQGCRQVLLGHCLNIYIVRAHGVPKFCHLHGYHIHDCTGQNWTENKGMFYLRCWDILIWHGWDIFRIFIKLPEGGIRGCVCLWRGGRRKKGWGRGVWTSNLPDHSLATPTLYSLGKLNVTVTIWVMSQTLIYAGTRQCPVRVKMLFVVSCQFIIGTLRAGLCNLYQVSAANL